MLKALGSASAIAFSITMYNRSLRSFLPDKKKQNIVSSLVYYLWNLFLLLSRLAALALFASVLPCFIFPHFLCSWLVLLFCAWRSKTDFMDSTGGEWLFRATVGLVWYFSWLNVADGKTRCRTLLYHTFILVDIGLLCGVWWWKMLGMEQPFFHISSPVATAVVSSVVGVYVVGLALKMFYYKFFHPNIAKVELKGGEEEGTTDQPKPDTTRALMVCAASEEERDGEVILRSFGSSAPPAEPSCNKRMRQLAGNFYCNA